MAVKPLVVVGNPKPQSRTRDAAVRLVAKLGYGEPEVIELSEVGAGLLGWGDEHVAEAVKRTQSADLVVFASPTFKATYTGLLKVFLDQFATGDGLAGVVGIPFQLGAGLRHALAPELLLKPVLVELGAIVPVQGLYQLDSAYQEDPELVQWIERWKPVVDASLAGAR